MALYRTDPYHTILYMMQVYRTVRYRTVLKSKLIRYLREDHGETTIYRTVYQYFERARIILKWPSTVRYQLRARAYICCGGNPVEIVRYQFPG